MEEKNSATCLQISKNGNRVANLVSTFTGIEKVKLTELLYQKAFSALRPFIFKSIETGELLDLDVEIKAHLKPEMVTGGFECDMNAPREETDAKTLQLVNEAFKSLDSAKESNKIKFKKALESLSA